MTDHADSETNSGSPIADALAAFEIRLMDRYVAAQEPIWATAQAELAAGHKTSHWMWWIFPQLALLGRSSTSRRWGFDRADEAVAFLAHDILGDRLRHCCELLLSLPAETRIAVVLGATDAMKLQSSMTLFATISGERIFRDVIDRYYGGELDATTLELVERE